MRLTHATHDPHHHIPRLHPHPHTHPTPRGIALTIPPPIRTHRGTLDTYVTSLIHDLTNSTPCAPRTYHTRCHKRTQPTPNTNNEKTSPLPTPTPSHKITYTSAETPTLHQPTPPTKTQKPPKKPVNVTPPLHTPTHPQNEQQPLTQDPTYNPQSQTALHTHDGHVEPPCNHKTQINSTYSNAKLGTNFQPHRPPNPQPMPTHPSPNRPQHTQTHPNPHLRRYPPSLHTPRNPLD